MKYLQRINYPEYAASADSEPLDAMNTQFVR